jgi:hypothetical protein
MKEQLDKVNPIPDIAKHPAKNPDAISLIQAAFDARAKTIPQPPTFLRAYANANDWAVDRNENTGIITGRDVQGELFYKGGKSGWCRMEHVSLHQDNQGGNKWGPATASTMGQMGPQALLTMGFHVDCAEVQALPPDPS